MMLTLWSKYERVKEQRYKAFQEWLNEDLSTCNFVTDYQDYTNEFDLNYYWDSPIEEDYDWRDTLPNTDCM